MSFLRCSFVSIVLLSVCCMGCGDGPRTERKETSPVTGLVTVDGQPAAAVRVELQNVQGIDSTMPTVSVGTTDDQGKFEITTYDRGDGAPEGEYIAIFTWPQMQLNQGVDAPDRLKNRYSTAAKSTFKVKVEKGKPTDMGNVALTTK